MEVELTRDSDKHKMMFEIGHACRLLRISGCGWRLRSKQFKFNGHDIIETASSKRSRKSDKED